VSAFVRARSIRPSYGSDRRGSPRRRNLTASSAYCGACGRACRAFGQIMGDNAG